MFIFFPIPPWPFLVLDFLLPEAHFAIYLYTPTTNEESQKHHCLRKYINPPRNKISPPTYS